MSKKMRFQGNWQDGQKEIEVNLAMILFEEDGSKILYCPALDISGYGIDESAAFDSFKTTMSEFFTYTIRKGMLLSELSHLGWKVKRKGKPMTPPTMQQLLERNDNFSRIFNNFPFRKFDQPVTFPAVA
jgi:hypothetical protein